MEYFKLNLRYEGMLSYSFDRFCVVKKFELPKVKDLHLTTVQFDSVCSYLDTGKDKNNFSSSYLPKFLAYCQKIVPYVNFYKKQIMYYDCTAHEMLANKIDIILTTFPKDKRHKRGIIGSIISGFIGLAYGGISSFLHHKCQNALQKAVTAMDRKVDIQHNKIFHLEDSMSMYGIYNSDTLEQLIEIVHGMHNTTSWHEEIYTGKIHHWFEWYLHKDGVGHYVTNSILFLTTIREKYVRMYECFLEQKKMYAKVIKSSQNVIYLFCFYPHQDYMAY